jgi:glycosyltransferase involved in cell wall biosynthesis
VPLIRIIGRDNGAGLSRDLSLLREVLAGAGHDTEVVAFGGGKGINLLRQAGLHLQQRWQGRADVQLFVERVYPGLLAAGRRNLLIPNPEWFHPDWLQYLPRFERVLCKTAHALPLFERLGCDTTFIGFTSEDRLDAAVPRERAFFHLAGRSSAKGTAVLLEGWRRHPEWPRLTVVQDARKAAAQAVAGASPAGAANIDLRIGHLPGREVVRLQNRHAFHACPSEMEGFGHSLMEAMSVGAVALATDGAPMNEMVHSRHGCLVAPARSTTKDLSPRYFVDAAGIEAGVARMLQLDDDSVRAMGAKARMHFQRADAEFRRRLPEAVIG